MQVELSQYLNGQLSLMRRLVSELKKDFDYVSILGTDTTCKQYSVRKTGSEVLDSSYFLERGFVVRVYNGMNYSEHSFNELSEELFESIYGDILLVGKDKVHGLKEQSIKMTSYPRIEEESIHENFFGEVKILSDSLTSKEKLDKMTTIMETGLKMSDELIDFRVNYQESWVSKAFISNKKEMTQSYIWSTVFLIPIAKRDEIVQFAYESLSGLKGVEILDEINDYCEKAIEDTVSLLDAKRMVAGEYDIICDPGVAGVIAHEAFGHGVEMDMFVKDRAKALEYINKQVASDHVSMKDGAKSAYNVGSYFFDDEGTLGSDTLIIENGMLKSGISDLVSAMQLGTIPTGNGRRESYERKAYARMTNTCFTEGECELSDMIASIDHGYLLEGVKSGMEDPKNWGIQVVALFAKEIRDGRLTGKIVAPVYLTGYVPELLQSITMMSKDVKISGAGACGKGHKEYVKAADGGPYIKARGRLS